VFHADAADVGRRGALAPRTKGLNDGLRVCLSDQQQLVHREGGENLFIAAGPTYGQTLNLVYAPQAEVELARDLSLKSGGQFNVVTLSHTVGFDYDFRPERVGMGLGRLQAHACEVTARTWESVFQQLKSSETQADEVEISVLVKIKRGEGPPIVDEVEAESVGDGVEDFVAGWIDEEYIPFAAAEASAKLLNVSIEVFAGELLCLLL
jgi:hypothetical protein